MSVNGGIILKQQSYMSRKASAKRVGRAMDIKDIKFINMDVDFSLHRPIIGFP